VGVATEDEHLAPWIQPRRLQQHTVYGFAGENGADILGPKNSNLCRGVKSD
jgi:hypothetical protein